MVDLGDQIGDGGQAVGRGLGWGDGNGGWDSRCWTGLMKLGVVQQAAGFLSTFRASTSSTVAGRQAILDSRKPSARWLTAQKRTLGAQS